MDSQKMFFESGLEVVKDFHESVDSFEEWLTTAEDVIYRDCFGNSYQELCAYYDAVKVAIQNNSVVR